MLEFLHPWFFLGLLLLPAYLYYEWKIGSKKRIYLPFTRLTLVRKIVKRENLWKYVHIVLNSLIILLLVLSLVRPRLGFKSSEVEGKGIDIVIALDVSGSMQAVDFKPTNRLEAAKAVARDFISDRQNDRIGLVVFSEYALTQCPLTLDYNILLQLLDNITINQDASSTAIGMGLATAVARLKNSEAKSKVIILITDGMNNTGEIDPFTAADLAATYKIRVYPIGVGSKGLVDFPVDDPNFGRRYVKVQIDMDMATLDRIASITGTGTASLATNTEELGTIIKNIDNLERTKYKINNYYTYKEMFSYLLGLAGLLILIQFILLYVWRRELP
ncbi:MAG TPA: VWA domain-containing protein [Candidatus Cloacimonadota bacterium]|nr:VWA domain-containing protein [Candidatus Cloacimonadota bacterium]HPT71509.1 VWA domain-containing protein [Candidatus Cloacimonadota bacterium]